MASFWPEPVAYAEAVQTPAINFADPQLRAATAEAGMLGPIVYSGNFANVYHLVSSDGRQSWAVKCFTRRVSGQQQRYQRISEHLDQTGLQCAVDFQYLAEGIRVHGEWFPILKMDWVDGMTLSEFVDKNVEDHRYISRLYNIWLRLEPYLRSTQTVHGDLQHGNVMLVPGQSQGKLSLRVIDYDGMWTPELASTPPGETGHAAYQHPDRLRLGVYSSDVDRFPHLVIAAALRCLSRPDQVDLWRRYYDGDNLLFKKSDFADPGSSELLHELWTSRTPELRAWAGLIAISAVAPLNETPRLEQRLVDGKLPTLGLDELARSREILGPTESSPARGTQMTPDTGVAENWWEAPLDMRADEARNDVEDAIAPLPATRPSSRSTKTKGAGTRSTKLYVLSGIAAVLAIGIATLTMLPRSPADIRNQQASSPQSADAADALNSRPVAERDIPVSGSFTWLPNREMAKLEQSGQVACVAFSPDGTKLASTSERNILIWNSATGEEILSLPRKNANGHAGTVEGVGFSPDGQHLASASSDKTVKIWDLTTGLELHTLSLDRSVMSVAYSPDGKFVSASDRVWDASNGREVCRLKGQVGIVWSIVFSPDGNQLISANMDKSIRIWDPSTGMEQSILTGHSGDVRSLAPSRKGDRLASASVDRTIKIWDLATGTSTLTLSGHAGQVEAVEFSPDGKTLASAGSDHDIKLWNIDSGEETATLKGHTAAVRSVAFSPDGQRLVSGSNDRTVRIWGIVSGQDAASSVAAADPAAAAMTKADPQPPADEPVEASPLKLKDGLLAHFRFNGDDKNEGSGEARFDLQNVEFRDGALYSNGQYVSSAGTNPQRVVCRVPKFNYNAFTVALRFKAEEFGPKTSTLITGGTSYRWFGMHRSPNGNLIMALNNYAFFRELKGITLEPMKWYVLAAAVDLSKRTVVISANGEQAATVDLPTGFEFDVTKSNFAETDKTWTFQNYANGSAFHGLVDELLIYNRALSDEELVGMTSLIGDK